VQQDVPKQRKRSTRATAKELVVEEEVNSDVSIPSFGLSMNPTLEGTRVRRFQPGSKDVLPPRGGSPKAI